MHVYPRLVGIALCLFALHCSAQTKPLAIKGVSIGDTIEKSRQIGMCDILVGTTCWGKTMYGPFQSSFTMSFAGGLVSSIWVRFDEANHAEVVRALVEQFGEPTLGAAERACPKNPSVCSVWAVDGVQLMVAAGSAMLDRVAPKY